MTALVDHSGRLARFTLRPGNAVEAKEVEPLLDGVPATSELIADRAFDTNAVRAVLTSRGIVATIPSRQRRRERIPHDEESYKRRHLVENLCATLKQFRGLATRYCKLASTFRSMVCLAGWFVATRSAT